MAAAATYIDRYNLVYNLVRISRKYWRNLRSVLAKLTVGELPQWNDERRTKGCAQRLRFCSNAYGSPFRRISQCLFSSLPRPSSRSIVFSPLQPYILSFPIICLEFQVVSPKPVLRSWRTSRDSSTRLGDKNAQNKSQASKDKVSPDVPFISCCRTRNGLRSYIRNAHDATSSSGGADGFAIVASKSLRESSPSLSPNPLVARRIK